mgnify:CR=1 FL=1
MLKSHSRLVTAAAIAALFFGGSAALAEEQAQPQGKDMSNSLCKDVTRASGENRVIALALLHGYRLGKKNTTQYDAETLGAISDKFVEYCLDHPSDKALAAFEKIAE